ncbi:431_t:CDS:2 [Ambispora gerdemannii]|uniref:431_t:CDS:1 n=1 Tax=Ambispora gerdemannii TaxID=144530 RepID=A0A9N8ZTP4_9GLOM|nr:431_t:CDS:2 [Ambispora gerdemannii]
MNHIFKCLISNSSKSTIIARVQPQLEQIASTTKHLPLPIVVETKDKAESNKENKTDLNESPPPPTTRWTEEETKKLKEAVKVYGQIWAFISENIFDSTRTPKQIAARWWRLKKQNCAKDQEKELGLSDKDWHMIKKINRSTWSTEDEKKLLEAVEEYGQQWSVISKKVFGMTREPGSIRTKYLYLMKKQGIPDTINTRHFWTQKEDNLLCEAVKEIGTGRWVKIAERIPGISNLQARVRWTILNHSKRGQWTPEEDQKLLELYKKHNGGWSKISEEMKRPASVIRTHYEICMRPGRQVSFWSQEEIETIKQGVKEYGNEWDLIMKRLPGRSMILAKRMLQDSPKLNPHVNVGKWSQAEIELLHEGYKKYGNQWIKVAKLVNTRTPKQCWRYWTEKRYDTEEDINNNMKHKYHVKPFYCLSESWLLTKNKDRQEIDHIEPIKQENLKII